MRAKPILSPRPWAATAGFKGLPLEMHDPPSPKKKTTMSEQSERLYGGLVTVNEENINHLKCCFRAHETEMKHKMKCSFISEGFILLTLNHSILFAYL